MERILITGSGGLVGGEATRYFSNTSEVLGIDNDSRGKWFGESGSVMDHIADNKSLQNYTHLSINVSDFEEICKAVERFKPTAVIHCAGQPSHEKSAAIPLEDFQVNTVGTVNVLEACRRYSPKATFVYTSTNKVYGDTPNHLPVVDNGSRFDFCSETFGLQSYLGYTIAGINEFMTIDASIHSPYGANKVASDLIIQEYGRYYGMNTVCFRCGCITGKNHKGVPLHGFLSYLCKTAKAGKTYTVFGYGGKQVRDNIHVHDLIRAFDEFIKKPKHGAVYNMGGGKANSCSILEAKDIIKRISGIDLHLEFKDAERKGDHICYYTDYSRFKSHYRDWSITRSLDNIFEEMLA